MALSSISTDAEVLAQYDNSARYFESTAKAQDLLEAIVILLMRLPASQSIAGRSLSRQSLESLRAEVEKYVTAGQTATRSSWTRGKPI